jgi:hypothetical protein
MAVKSFRERYARTLPAQVVLVSNRLLEQAMPYVSDATATGATRQEQASAALLLLGLFESEVNYLLNDGQAAARSRCELGFEHLRRLIVADSLHRERWQAAFTEGELACEKLGATHLLYHGIWTFKTSAAGGRTDLVYAEPLDIERAIRVANGLVLTEWKKTSARKATAAETARLFEEARAQARRYAEGPLAGFELTDYRYVVVVSWENVETPDDLTHEGILYRHVNIPVAPLVPSKQR